MLIFPMMKKQSCGSRKVRCRGRARDQIKDGGESMLFNGGRRIASATFKQRPRSPTHLTADAMLNIRGSPKIWSDVAREDEPRQRLGFDKGEALREFMSDERVSLVAPQLMQRQLASLV